MTQRFTVVFALYPELTQLDFTGPHEVLRRLPNAHCVLASTTGGTLDTGSGLCFAGLRRLAEVPECNLLCVPGGYGTLGALVDAEYLRELKRLGNSADYVTSVCTGSLLLAAAGLLPGKRAACHWAWRDLLQEFGVIPDSARVVRDGRVITGGGVTAGIDMALQVVAEIAGQDFAAGLELAIEYAPEPPFHSGRPEWARASTLQAVQAGLEARAGERRRVVARVAATTASPIVAPAP